MDVDKQETMEETILVGDDLMRGPPSPVIPKDIASHVLEGVELCDGILKNLFLCLQINDIEPFCQDEIVLYRQCAEKRDKEIRERMQDSEYKLGVSMPLEGAKERVTQLQSEITLLERRMILASGLGGMEGFRQRWSLHGQLEDTRKRLEALNHGIGKRENQSSTGEGPKSSPAGKRWFFCWSLSSAPALSVFRTGAANGVVVRLDGRFRIVADAVPVTEEDSRVHGYGVRPAVDGSLAHLNVAFKFYAIGADVHGVLGQTYRRDYVAAGGVDAGARVPVMGGADRYLVSDIFATDCEVARFAGEDGGGLVGGHMDIIEEPTDALCGSGKGSAGLVCKK
ncbi:unnamed protein product [Urochloa decumbens]|uniref:DUF7803 domain-containing protein n=1 Tax=Urochloa decumbens TaxID=240449 RepID=A0ABC9D761_9POAL